MSVFENIDHGELSTIFVTFGIPLLLALGAYIQLHPEIVNNYLGATDGAFVLFIIGFLIYNYQNPRTNPEPPME